MRKRDPDKNRDGTPISRSQRATISGAEKCLRRRSDLSVSFIADLELGNTGTRLENFVRLCRLLEVNADYILFGDAGPAVQRVTDLLRDRDEETVRVVEQTVEALLRALDAQRPEK